MSPIFSCEKNQKFNNEISSIQPILIKLNDTLDIDVKLYENGFVKSIISKNKLGIKNGFELEYYPNGILKKKYFNINAKINGEFWEYNDLGEVVYSSTYVDGIKMGNTFEYSSNRYVKSHFLFEDDNAIYLGYYENGKKQLNSIMPVFKEESLTNDSIYQAKINFPFPYKGSLEIYLHDTINFKKEYKDKYNLNLTITNFNKSWKKYDMLLEYIPADEDSLIWTEQVYGRNLKID